MADQKISELAAATSVAGPDLINIVQGGQNKKITFANMLANLNSPLVYNESGADVDARFEGVNDQNLLVTDASADAVGVGTANPQAKLDVAGDVAITGGALRLEGAETVSSYPATLSATAGITKFTVSGAGDTASLPDGDEGQVRVLLFATGSGTLTVTPSNAIGFSNITFNNVGDIATLLFVDSAWVIMSINGASS